MAYPFSLCPSPVVSSSPASLDVYLVCDGFPPWSFAGGLLNFSHLSRSHQSNNQRTLQALRLQWQQQSRDHEAAETPP